MKSIHISPAVQIAGALTGIGVIAAAVAAQLPEMQRYLKIRSMD